MNKRVDDPVDYLLVGVLTTTITVKKKKKNQFFFFMSDHCNDTHGGNTAQGKYCNNILELLKKCTIRTPDQEKI